MKIVTSKLHNGLLYLGDINSVLSNSIGGYAVLPRTDSKGFYVRNVSEWLDFPEVPQWLSSYIRSMGTDASWFLLELIEATLYRNHMFVDYDKYSEFILYEDIERYVTYLIEGPPPSEATEGNNNEDR